MVPCEVETPAAHGKLGQIWPGRHEGKEEKRAGGRRAEIRALLRPRDPAAGPPTTWGLALTPSGGAGHPPASRGKRAGGEHPSVLPPPSPGCGASPWTPMIWGGQVKPIRVPWHRGVSQAPCLSLPSRPSVPVSVGLGTLRGAPGGGLGRAVSCCSHAQCSHLVVFWGGFSAFWASRALHGTAAAAAGGGGTGASWWGWGGPILCPSPSAGLWSCTERRKAAGGLCPPSAARPPSSHPWFPSHRSCP